jgi:HK97 family phage major capsid protein
MTTPAPRAAVPGIVQPPWQAMFPADVQPVISAIVGGAPFSRACTPLPTNRSAVAFPVLDTAAPGWIAELEAIPDLGASQSAYEVAASKLAGTILLSLESIEDSTYPITAETETILADTFSHQLDADLIGAAGPAPTPNGILSVAAAADGTDLELAAVAGKSAIGTSGGIASHFCVSPHHLGELESARDTLGRALYPDAATTFCGLTTVMSVGATQPFVFDRSRTWLVINRDFTADMSGQTDAAWSHYAMSMRVIGRFALAVPQPLKAVRKLTVAGVAPATVTPAHAAKK